MKRELVFTVNSRPYTVKIPTNGQLINIESLKVSLSRGQYSTLMQSRTVASMLALESIDMISFLTVLCPNLIEDLKVTNLTELDVFDSQQLTTCYRTQIAPWILEWQTILAKVPTKEILDESPE